MEKKNWYAVLAGSSDNDWGTGSFCWSEAVAMSKSRGCEMIAEIDGGYDEDDRSHLRRGVHLRRGLLRQPRLPINPINHN